MLPVSNKANIEGTALSLPSGKALIFFFLFYFEIENEKNRVNFSFNFY